ncbi:hypothetical protein RAB80_018372, partial [Fusarium oxysporum f. sp. vasinfectum]
MPWTIKHEPEWQAYNAFPARQPWWPAFSDDGSGYIIASGEVWCRVRYDDGHWCKSKVKRAWNWFRTGLG